MGVLGYILDDAGDFVGGAVVGLENLSQGRGLTEKAFSDTPGEYDTAGLL